MFVSSFQHQPDDQKQHWSVILVTGNIKHLMTMHVITFRRSFLQTLLLLHPLDKKRKWPDINNRSFMETRRSKRCCHRCSRYSSVYLNSQSGSSQWCSRFRNSLTMKSENKTCNICSKHNMKCFRNILSDVSWREIMWESSLDAVSTGGECVELHSNPSQITEVAQ